MYLFELWVPTTKTSYLHKIFLAQNFDFKAIELKILLQEFGWQSYDDVHRICSVIIKFDFLFEK